MRKFLLVDMYNLFHRCKHVGSGDVHLKAGMALHIAFNSIRKMKNEFGIEHVVICLEGGSWRKKIYPEYKANRKLNDASRTPREIKDDEYYFSVMNDFITFLEEKTNVTILKESEVEADDFIARWIQVHPDDSHVILTSDSDFYQLLSDNVKIFDGVKGYTITNKEVLNDRNKPAFKSKKVRDKRTNKLKEEKIFLTPPNPEYELFKKCIRGDSSDNIMSSYPNVKENGSIKKPGIVQAFEDRKNKGLLWNEFMLTEWDKVIDSEYDDNGDFIKSITQKVRVKDEYEINKKLIDLTQQPDYIKDRMDAKIIEQVQKTKKSQVGISFMKFSAKHDLKTISQNPQDYSKILSQSYN